MELKKVPGLKRAADNSASGTKTSTGAERTADSLAKGLKKVPGLKKAVSSLKIDETLTQQ